MKKFICILSCVIALILTGCSSYTRDSDSGELINITVKQMQEKIEKKDDFILLFTQTTCGACQEFHKVLDTYLLNHNVTIYEVVLDEEPVTNRKSDLKTIRKTFPDFKNTPSVYFVKDGKLKSEATSENVTLTKDVFDTWIQDHRLDEKK